MSYWLASLWAEALGWLSAWVFLLAGFAGCVAFGYSVGWERRGRVDATPDRPASRAERADTLRLVRPDAVVTVPLPKQREASR